MAGKILRVSSENHAFQHAVVLKANRTKRQRYQEFFVEGVQAINQAVAFGWSITTLIYSSEQPLSRWAQHVLAAAPSATRLEMSPRLLHKLSDKDEPSELLALVAMPDDDLTRIVPMTPLLLAVFDRPVSPGNLGTLIRSCDAFHADGLVVTGHGADVYDPATIRASTGSLFALPVVRAASHRALAEWFPALAKAAGPFQVVGTAADGDTAVDALDLTAPTVLVFGNETLGLSAGYRDLCERTVRIPTAGSAESLNVACAASIVLYEVDRQRRASRLSPRAGDRPYPSAPTRRRSEAR
jgi:TrmH family RNA methyltransferase